MSFWSYAKNVKGATKNNFRKVLIKTGITTFP